VKTMAFQLTRSAAHSRRLAMPLLCVVSSGLAAAKCEGENKPDLAEKLATEAGPFAGAITFGAATGRSLQTH
jgi:hypothetical protein